MWLIALIVALPVGPASAHANVDEVIPADGSLLAEAPTVVEMRFSEPILANDVSVELTSSGLSASSVPIPRLADSDPTRLLIDMPPLADGVHQLRVVAHDRADLHEVVARISFAIGDAAPLPSAPVLTPPEPIESASRWLFASGLALLIGAIAIRTRWPDVSIARPDRLHRLTTIGLVSVLVGRVGVVLARAIALDTDIVFAMRSTLSTPDARRLPFDALACLCLVPLLTPLRAAWLDMPAMAKRRLSVRLAVSWVGVIWLSLLAAWGDHSALSGSIDPFSALAKATHLMGLGLWVGVLAVTMAANWARPTLRPALHAMSRIAVLGAFLTAGSGLLMASRFVVSMTALLSTTYGQLLTTKALLMLIAAALGWSVHRRTRRRVLLVELGALVTVVLIGSAISTAAPAIDRSFVSHDIAAGSLEAPSVSADDLLVQIRAIPGEPGTNALEIRTSDTRRPSPGAITQIVVRLGGAEYTVIPDANGVAYVAGVMLPAGDAAVNVGIQRGQLPVAAAATTVTTRAAEYVAPVRLSSAPLRWPLTISGMALIAVAALIGSRSRRPGHTEPDRSRTPTQDVLTSGTAAS